MRVLHVLEATTGGTKRHLLDLLPGLQATGIEVHVACPPVRDEHHGDTSFWHDLASHGIPAHAVPMTRRPLSRANLRAVPTLTRLIRQSRFDVVHAHSSIAGALARPAAALSRKRPKIVYSPHGYAFLSAEWGRRAAAFRLLERQLARLTDLVIAVSDAEAQDGLRSRVVRPHQLAVIPNGVVSADFPDQRQSIERLAPELARWSGAPLVGTVARMTPQKDPLTWLRVAALVRETIPEARFVWIWGGGALEQSVYEETDRLGLRQHVAFLGHRPDARQLLGSLDVFLLTSRFEGLPYSVIEALAAGTPVVATDVAGTRDVVKHDQTGLLAPPSAAGALAQHVRALLGDRPLARRLGAAGRADVLTRFSVEQMVQSTRRVYEQITPRGH